MAFGFTPKFEQDLDLNGLDAKPYLAIALETIKQLDWRLSYTSRSGLIAYVGGGFFSSMEEFRLVIHDNTVFVTSKNAGNGMYDWGKNKDHVKDFIDTFARVQASLTEDELDEKIAELSPVFEAEKEDKLALPPAGFTDNLKYFISLFVPRKDYFITPIIVDINILVFTVMVISGVSFFEPTSIDLLKWGANLRAATLEGQWWRLLTNVFLHIGIFHLLFNMYALVYIGILLEPYLGRLRFAAAYLFSGIIASLTSIYWHPVTISAGASGAIFGMYGVFLAMLTTNFIDKSMRKPLLISISVFVVYNLMNGMKAGIDNAAHLGGLLSGLFIGYAYYPSLSKPLNFNVKYMTIGALAICFLCTSFVIYRNIPDDYVKYDAYMKDFARREELALSVFKMPETSSRTEIIMALHDKGINNWKQNLRLLDSMDKLDLPVEFLVRDNKLRRYCNLRIKSYGYIANDVRLNTRLYQSAIDSCNIQLSAMVDSLKNGN